MPMLDLDKGKMERRVGGYFTITLFLVLPAVLPLFRRAAPVFLITVGAIAAFILWRDLRLGFVLKSRLRKPAALLFFAFMAWAAISLAWSTVPARGFTNIVTVLALVVSFSLISEFPVSKNAPHCLAIGLAIGCGIIAIDLLSGLPILRFINQREVDAWRYNMVCVTYCLSSVALLSHREAVSGYMLTFVMVLFAAAVFLGESETAKLVILLLPIIILVISFFPSSALKVSIFGSLVSFFIFASSGMPGLSFIKSLVPPSFWQQASGDERLAIWLGFADFAGRGLPFGWGTATSAYPQGTPFYISAAQEVQVAISHWHPHNNFVQILTELGLPGSLIVLWMLVIFILKCFSFYRSKVPFFLVYLCVTVGVASVSHGFWQSWWWAAVLIGWYSMAGGEEYKS